MAKNTACALVFLATTLACTNNEPSSRAKPTATSASAPAPSAESVPVAGRKVDVVEHAMGTEVHFVAFTTETLDEHAVRRAIGLASDEIGRLEKMMSSWRDDSEISEINRRAGEPVRVSSETLEVIRRSLWASKISDGVFDVTFGAMNDVWKFGDAAENPPKLPPKELIEQRRSLIDYRRIVLNETDRTVAIGADQRLDLGGIAKGYIVDRAVAVLRREGVQTFLAQAGGDLYGAGKKPDGSPWTSGIQDPRGKRGEFFATIELENRAFSTAGDYARSFVLSGRRYHHIIDPRTGYPAEACRSVTIWAEDAFTADAIDDVVFILGPERGLKLVESLPGAGAVIVDSDNKVIVSKRLKDKVHILRQPTGGI